METTTNLDLPLHEDCSACSLRQTASRVVPGRGNPASKLVFVGEAPGKDEDAVGQPFVGASGKLLRSIVDAMPGMRADAYFYTNTYHCRPPGNKIEIAEKTGQLCPKMWLTTELRTIKPAVIVATGKTACAWFRPNDVDMPMRWHVAKDHYDEGLQAWVVGMYHPSYALRQGVGEGSREGNIALVSMTHSLQRAMYYLLADGYVPEVTEPDGLLG